MMTFESLRVTITGLDPTEVERWVAQDLLRPDGPPGAWEFSDIDVARLHLIRELRHELGVEDGGLPVVLQLLDQLYDTRRQLRRLRDAFAETAPEDVRAAVLDRMLPPG